MEKIFSNAREIKWLWYWNKIKGIAWNSIKTQFCAEHLWLEVNHQMSSRHQCVYYIRKQNISLQGFQIQFALTSCKTNKRTKLNNVSDKIQSKRSFVQSISGWRSLPPNVNQASMFFTSIFTGDQRIQKNSFENALLPYKHTVWVL